MDRLHKIAQIILNMSGGRTIQLFMTKRKVITKYIYNHTKFLDDKAGLIQRAYCIQHNIMSTPTCKCCNSIVKWDKTRRLYKTYCSLICKGSDGTLKAKVKKTVLARYGVENVSQSDVIKAQKVSTCLQNHGVNYPQQCAIIHGKSKDTNNVNFGVNYPLQAEQPYKQYVTRLLFNYGVDNPSKSPVIQSRKVETNITRYGAKHWMQRDIPKSTICNLNNKKWLYDQHFIQQKPLSIIAEEMSVTDGTVAKYLHNHGYETQHYTTSVAENDIANIISNTGIDIIRNNRDILPNNTELDIFIPSHNIAIEYNGLYWHSNIFKDKQYHKIKYNLCEDKKIRLLTIFEDEWLHRREVVTSKILSILHKTPDKRIYARKTECVTINTEIKTRFLNANHIQGVGRGSISYGLEYNNQIIACITFIKNKDNSYILNRYATNCTVVGGFSKLLTHFKRNNMWYKITTFADLRWSVGDLYNTCGFVVDKVVPVDYNYIDLKHRKRIHKFNYRRKFLPKLLDNFEPTLSESENCYNNRIFKIWNCGLLRFVMYN